MINLSTQRCRAGIGYASPVYVASLIAQVFAMACTSWANHARAMDLLRWVVYILGLILAIILAWVLPFELLARIALVLLPLWFPQVMPLL